MPDVEMITGYEGANPQDASLIERLGPTAFRVCPESEDGDSNYKFACDVTARNPGHAPTALDLTIDWQEPPEVGTRYMKARDSLFVETGGERREFVGRVEADRVHFTVPLPPGASRLSMAPAYGADELRRFFDRALALPGARRFAFGQTAEGRPMQALALPSCAAPDLCVVAIGTLHPYEKGGSYFVDGIADLLAGPRGADLRRHVAFVLAPMGNPDGVAHGFCKRTTTGCDLAEAGNVSADPTACALRGLLAGVAAAAPHAAWIDAHNWMIRHDGLFVYRDGLAERMRPALVGDLFPAPWEITARSDLAPDPATPDLRHYAATVLGLEMIVTSTPWYGRTTAQVRRIGGIVTEAFVKAVLDLPARGAQAGLSPRKQP